MHREKTPRTTYLRLFLCFTCPAITVATVILRALDRIRGRALDWLGPGSPKSQPNQALPFYVSVLVRVFPRSTVCLAVVTVATKSDSEIPEDDQFARWVKLPETTVGRGPSFWSISGEPVTRTGLVPQALPGRLLAGKGGRPLPPSAADRRMHAPALIVTHSSGWALGPTLCRSSNDTNVLVHLGAGVGVHGRTRICSFTRSDRCIARLTALHGHAHPCTTNAW